MTDKTYHVLFLCTGNSARSILAECILNRVDPGRFHALSAGSTPTGEVHPYALDLLQQLAFPTEGLRSKDWSEFSRPGSPELDFVFTVCDKAAGETCPVWRGQPVSAHWGVPDPAAVEGNEAERRQAFADAYWMLKNRIGAFASLPFASLDRLGLQSELDAIGRAQDSADG